MLRMRPARAAGTATSSAAATRTRCRLASDDDRMESPPKVTLPRQRAFPTGEVGNGSQEIPEGFPKRAKDVPQPDDGRDWLLSHADVSFSAVRDWLTPRCRVAFAGWRSTSLVGGRSGRRTLPETSACRSRYVAPRSPE